MPSSRANEASAHASIVTTERYDAQIFESLQRAASRLEAGKTSTSASQL